MLSEKRGAKVEIHTPQRGQKRAMAALAVTNAKHSFAASGCESPARQR
ncbi:MAG: hypothetical protein U5J83_04510 [Bryobacterales bacterium]|nr:hypothetical protein [Bryobacterales bacterium]